jgi:dihydropteroate synthase
MSEANNKMNKIAPSYNTLNCNGRIVSLHEPLLMGILNVTPDSFYDGGKYQTEKNILLQVEKMLTEGASMIDIGGMSSRPGAVFIDEKEELKRIIPTIESILARFPDTILSIDTWRASVAKESVATGASMINDISGGQFDPLLYETVGILNVPFVLMHIKGEPTTMQQQPHYENLHEEILAFFVEKVKRLLAYGVKDIILDVGFGFGKTIAHNYDLLRNLHAYHVLGYPQLVGVSRKSIIYKYLDITAAEALNGTTALHLFALQQGAKILRVHDVKEANEVLKLYKISA